MKIGRNIITIILLAVFFSASSILLYQGIQGYNRARYLRGLMEKRKGAWGTFTAQLMREIDKFKGDSAVIIKDLESGWEFVYQKDKLYPSASLAKIPIMAAAFIAAGKGKVNLDTEIALKPSDKLTGSGVLKSLPAGTLFNFERLIGFMIYDSDNTATNIVTKTLGIDYLNNTFKELGLKHTKLLRRVADYRLRNQGVENYTTAEDMAFLLEKIYLRSLFNKQVSDKCIGLLKLTRMNDRIPRYLPADITIAHKTGLERNVCHDVGLVLTPKGNFLICVLTNYKNTDLKTAKQFIARIALLTYKFYEK
ncbi:MAG: Extended-spectrum beta-lactamase PER-1 precursor [Candidatus Omnitrophica bacterium ADurb.Bin205]|nr:MAG: Extended-spectrum beta-lactamase PER-1 precursor [Candidatus Omnitrophica bacterium ADurb.Bin205]